MKQLLFFIILTAFTVQSQSNTDFLNKYHKYSVEIGIGYYYGSEISPLPSSLGFRYQSYIAPKFGVYYDIYRKNQFNIRTGVSAFLLRDIELVRIDASENSADSGMDAKVEFQSAEWQFNIPITVEYLTYLHNSKITFNGSLMIGYENYGGVAIMTSGVGRIGGERTSLTRYTSRGNDVWHPSGQIGVGMYFPYRKWMLRVNLHYTKLFEKMYRGTFVYDNLQTTPDFGGTYGFKGDSFGVDFTVYLAKKSKLRKSKKKK